MDYQHLSTLLWREQELLDLLLFKAEEKHYLIVQGKTRWLGRIAHEIEMILEQLAALEVQRAAETEALARDLGLDPNPSLRQVAQAAPPAWTDLLMNHHDKLMGQVAEIRSLSNANRDLLDGGLAALDDALATTRPLANTYTASGRADSDTHRAVTLDGAL